MEQTQYPKRKSHTPGSAEPAESAKIQKEAKEVQAKEAKEARRIRRGIRRDKYQRGIKESLNIEQFFRNLKSTIDDKTAPQNTPTNEAKLKSTNIKRKNNSHSTNWGTLEGFLSKRKKPGPNKDPVVPGGICFGQGPKLKLNSNSKTSSQLETSLENSNTEEDPAAGF